MAHRMHRVERAALETARAAEDDLGAAYEDGFEDARAGRPGDRPDDPALGDVYALGRRDGRAERRRATPRDRRAATGRRSRRQPVALRTAARQLRAPIRRQAGSGLRVTGLTLGVVALYLALESAQGVAGFLGGLAGGLRWLQRPDRSVPYGPGFVPGASRFAVINPPTLPAEPTVPELVQPGTFHGPGG